MREGWTLKKMEEVYEVRDGTHDSPKYQNEGHPLITSKNLKNGILNFDKVKLISEKDYLQINKRSKVNLNDVLFAMIGTIGNPVVITEEPHFAIKNVALFKTNKGQNSKYLKYYLETKDVIEKMNREAKGTTQRFVGLGYLRTFPIPIPPLQEQNEIVSILDQAFAAIDKAKANLEKNIANAKELFQSKLNEVFSQRGEGWEEKTLGEICIFENGDRGKNYPSRSKFVESGVAFINAGHFNEGKIKKEKLDYISPSTFNLLSRGKFHKNDLLFCLRGSLGKHALIEDGLIGAIASSLVIVRPHDDYSSRYIGFYFQSSHCSFMIKKYAGGAAQPNLGATDLKKFAIKVPPMAIQEKIVEELQNLECEKKRVFNKYKSKTELLEDLKKSLLQKAFIGELLSAVKFPEETAII